MPPPPVSHQTARLSVGRHADPRDGMCVMELASVLSGRRFTDRPAEVCPFIAAFLRGYNDQLRDDERQARLLPWASRAVGTRSRNPDVLERRVRVIEQFARDVLPPWARHRRRYASCRFLRCEYLGGRLARWARDDAAHLDEVDLLLTALCEIDDTHVALLRARVAAPLPAVRG